MKCFCGEKIIFGIAHFCKTPLPASIGGLVKKPPEVVTLRDQFAMAAIPRLTDAYSYPRDYFNQMARDAYELADAMIKRRGE